jgi:hypothetical protein
MKTLPFRPIAWTLTIFAGVIFTLDMLLGLLFPNWWVMQKLYEFLLPGFTFISWGTFFLGLVESLISGFLVAVLFVPLYNYFAGREASRTPTMTPAAQHH